MAEPLPLSKRLNVRVAIQAPPDADDATIQSDTGEVDRDEDNWRTLALSVWAELLPDSAGEVVIGDQAIQRQRWKATIRRRDDLAAGMRLKVLTGHLKGQFLKVEGHARAERDETTVLICRQGRTQ